MVSVSMAASVLLHRLLTNSVFSSSLRQLPSGFCPGWQATGTYSGSQGRTWVTVWLSRFMQNAAWPSRVSANKWLLMPPTGTARRAAVSVSGFSSTSRVAFSSLSA